MNKKFEFFVIYYLPVIAWMVMIFKFSSGSVPSASNVYWQDFVVKKVAHVIVFGILSILSYRALVGTRMEKSKALVWAIVFTVFYGVTDEYHQSFTATRGPRIRDIGFDGLGALIAGTMFHKALERSKKWQEKLL